MNSRTVALATALALVPAVASPAAAQVFTSTPRVEVAEVRGLDAIPGDLAQGFETATPASVFDPAVKTVLVRFQAARPPASATLFVAWVSVPESAAPVPLKRTQIDPARLSSGVVDALTSEGQALPLGRYIVSLADANNRVFRAVEFRVGAAPRVRLKPPVATRLEKVYFDEYSLTYPNTFTPQPIKSPMTGMFLRRGAPFGMMFAVLSDPKSDTVLPQARAIVDVMLARLDAGAMHVTKTEVRDVPASQFPPGMLVGKTMEITLTRGMSAQATFYSKNVEGRRVLFGYMAITGHGVPAEYERLLTTDPEALAEDFLRMVSSFKGGTPWGARTPDEP